MKELLTVRIYFEHGQKSKNLSFWKRLNYSDFSTELLKRAKANDLKQALSFNVSKGYLEKGKIYGEISETRHFRHPHMVELTDTKENIETFLHQETDFLGEIKMLIVKNEVVVW